MKTKITRKDNYKDSYKFSLPSIGIISMIPIVPIEQPKMEIVYLDYNYNG